MTGKMGPRGPRIPVIWGPGGPSLGGAHFTLTPAPVDTVLKAISAAEE